MKPAIEISGLNLFYGLFHALKDVSLAVERRKITALIGPSGCGKSTLLRVLNRMNDLIPECRITGSVLVEGRDIYAGGEDVCALRKKVGMVFQRPNPFPLTVRENVAFGLRVEGINEPGAIEQAVEESLKAAWLWENVKDSLDRSALELPLDQQQRLCVARLLAVEPDVILMDEPCSALDPIATGKIEDLMIELRARYTIVIVTHNMQQASRISDVSAYMLLGEMIEMGPTLQLFSKPRDRRTEDYITGRYG
ncbi:MAG: phosphate ABC transporter ATP-binding protein [Lentisphaerae bacterium]|nr:phosphate ABC transporter ATP-binding protein [Lentisphaerota bacterium]